MPANWELPRQGGRALLPFLPRRATTARFAKTAVGRRPTLDKNVDDDRDTAVRRFRQAQSAAYRTLSDPDEAEEVRLDGEDGSTRQGSDRRRRVVGGGWGTRRSIRSSSLRGETFGSEAVEPYVGELGMATIGGGGGASFESCEDMKSAFGWSTTAFKRRKRETWTSPSFSARG